MASDLLHILAFRRALQRPELPPPVRALLDRHRRLAELGAVLVDLPYFENFLGRVVDDLRGKEDRGSLWGDRLHRDGALALAGALLREAQGSPVSDALTALALGHLTHVRLDLETHPVVNALVAARPWADRPGALHRTIESVQVELWHRETFGRRLFGAPHAFRLLAHPAGALGRGALGRSVARAFEQVFGEAPTPGMWRRWSRGLHLYALAVAGPPGWLHLSRRVLREGAAWMDGPHGSFHALVDHATRRMAFDLCDAWALGASMREHPERFAARFPERDLDCRELPPLPRPPPVQARHRASGPATTYL